MDSEPTAEPELDGRDLVLQFESLGDNCELGLVQRMAGAEPLGLLRFAGAPLRNLLRALDAGFDDIGDPDHVRLQADNGEYMVKLTKYDFNYHAHVKVGDVHPAALHRQQCRAVGFLAGKLLEDLRSPAKIFVFRQNEPLSAGDLIDLRRSLSRFGPSVLLWVQPARTGHPPGTVEVVGEQLLAGYVRRLASRQNVPDLDFDSWMSVLRGAHRLWHGGLDPLAGTPVSRTVLTFGTRGNAVPALGDGWSGPEAGFTWSVGERSVVTVPSPGDAADYLLEMEVTPYVSPPVLPQQRLDVRVGGTLIHSFDPLPRGEISCIVPGHLIAGRAEVEIVLDHPLAASPMLVAGEADDRRLAVSFNRLSLACARPG